jgi:hypothetical protein
MKRAAGPFLAHKDSERGKVKYIRMKEAFSKPSIVSTRLLPVKETSFGVSRHCVRSKIQGAGHPSSTHVNTHSFPADYNHPKISYYPPYHHQRQARKNSIKPILTSIKY